MHFTIVNFTVVYFSVVHCNTFHYTMLVRAILEEDDDVKIHLHDTVNWVSAKLSKSLRDHVKAGVFNIGDIVEVIVTLGLPHNLHIVSSIAWVWQMLDLQCYTILG